MIDIERIEPVRIDHPKLSDNRAAADVSLWRTAEGFECYTSFGGRIYHGVSADGRWLVLDYYPTIASGTRPSVAVWDKQFYVFYYDEDAPLHRSPRLAHGTDRHTLVSEELQISGVARNAKIAGFSVARLNERWILFFELTRAGITDIAYADAQELRGPWITRDILALGDGRRTQHCVLMSPAAAVVGGNIFLFYSAFDSRVSQVGCATLGGEPLHVEDQVYLTPARRFATRPSVTCALQWGPHMYAYIHAERETWRAICRMRTSA